MGYTTFRRVKSNMSELYRFCINWVNGNECEIGMPQEVCPSRADLKTLIADRDSLSSKYETRVYLLQKTEIRLKDAESRLAKAQELVKELIDDWPPEYDPESTDQNNMDYQFLKLEKLKKALEG